MSLTMQVSLCFQNFLSLSSLCFFRGWRLSASSYNVVLRAGSHCARERRPTAQNPWVRFPSISHVEFHYAFDPKWSTHQVGVWRTALEAGLQDRCGPAEMSPQIQPLDLIHVASGKKILPIHQRVGPIWALPPPPRPPATSI